MKKYFAGLVTIMALSWAQTLPAQTLVYSFESGTDGFFGLGATVSQEPTIGVTHLENSLKYEIGAGGFVGARTETVLPGELNNPPGVTHILFDLTITEAFAGAFADIGVTLFGHALNAPVPSFGNQVQFGDTVSIAALGVGTHLNLQIDLDQSVGPFRAGESFNQIFGPDPEDLTVSSGFQFYISKSAAAPLTVYLDNVRVVPEPSVIALLGIGAAALLAVRRRRLVG